MNIWFVIALICAIIVVLSALPALDGQDFFVFTFVVALFAGLAFLIVGGIVHDSNWKDDCHAQGGHVKNVDREMVCIGADGQYLGHS